MCVCECVCVCVCVRVRVRVCLKESLITYDSQMASVVAAALSVSMHKPQADDSPRCVCPLPHNQPLPVGVYIHGFMREHGHTHTQTSRFWPVHLKRPLLPIVYYITLTHLMVEEGHVQRTQACSCLLCIPARFVLQQQAADGLLGLLVCQACAYAHTEYNARVCVCVSTCVQGTLHVCVYVCVQGTSHVSMRVRVCMYGALEFQLFHTIPEKAGMYLCARKM